jgi:hypothetical protein
MARSTAILGVRRAGKSSSTCGRSWSPWDRPFFPGLPPNTAPLGRRFSQPLAELPAGAALHLAIRRLTAQVALPFEVRAARDYGLSWDVPWRPLDLGFLSRRHLPRYATEP